MNSYELSEELGVEHRVIVNVIRNYREDVETFGELSVEKIKIVSGRPREVYLLNESQCMLIVLFMKNSPDNVERKANFIKKLFDMRNELISKTFNLKG